MSKQLTLSAAFAAFSMALLAMAAAHGQFAGPVADTSGSQLPLFGLIIAQ